MNVTTKSVKIKKVIIELTKKEAKLLLESFETADPMDETPAVRVFIDGLIADIEDSVSK